MQDFSATNEIGLAHWVAGSTASKLQEESGLRDSGGGQLPPLALHLPAALYRALNRPQVRLAVRTYPHLDAIYGLVVLQVGRSQVRCVAALNGHIARDWFPRALFDAPEISVILCQQGTSQATVRRAKSLGGAESREGWDTVRQEAGCSDKVDLTALMHAAESLQSLHAFHSLDGQEVRDVYTMTVCEAP